MPDLSASVGLSLTKKPIHGYYTNFPLVESPISEGGIWTNSGGGWFNMNVTAPGKAWANRNFVTGNFDDGFAGLIGTGGPGYPAERWPADQFFEFQVRTQNQLSDPNFCEIEGQLRMTVGPTTLSGYEINWRVNHDNTQYHSITYWLGPLGVGGVCEDGCAFHEIVHMVAGDGFAGVFDGDICGASIVGNRIRTWIIHNGVKQILQDFLDTGGADGGARFKTGNPGAGHWHNGSSGSPSDFYHTWWRAGRAAA